MWKLAILSIFLIPGVTQAQSDPLGYYGATFGGVDNYHDSSRIADGDFQDARNILTDRGYLEKRPGSERIIEALNSGYAVNYIREFVNQSNVKYLIGHSSTGVYSTDLSAAAVKIATVNINGAIDSVPAYNLLFITNGYDTPFYTNGTSSQPVAAIPTCKYIEFAHERLFCANAAGYESTLYASEFGDYTDWTIPTGASFVASSPNSWTFDRQDGKPITCLFASPYGILVWKRNKMFRLTGVDNDDFNKLRVSENVGCLDDGSVQLVDGKVTWLGEGGGDFGVYQWAGGSNPPELISRDIDSTVKSVRQTSSNADLQQITTQDDFQAGSISQNGTPYSWDAVTTPGSIFASSWSVTETTGSATEWGAGTLTNLSTSSITGSIILNNDYYGTNTNLGGETCSAVNAIATDWLQSLDGGGETSNILCTASSGFSGTWGTYYLRTRDTNDTVSCSNGAISVKKSSDDSLVSSTTISATAATLTVNLVLGTSYYILAQQTGASCSDYAKSPTFSNRSQVTIIGKTTVSGADPYTNAILLDVNNSYQPSAVFTSQVFNTGFTIPAGGYFDVTVTTPAGTQVDFFTRESANGSTGWSSWAATSDTLRIPMTKQYQQYKGNFYTSLSTVTPQTNDVTLAAISTGTWNGAVLSVGTAITSWGQFNAVDNVSPAGVVSYYVRSASYAFTTDAASPSWSTQTNGLNLTCSTGAYVQARAVSSVVSSTESAQINSITINWSEGESKRVASLFYDGRYLLSCNTGADVTYNDTVLVYQRNRKWTIFDGLSYGGMTIFDNEPYASDGTTGSKIWRIMKPDLYYDDNTSAIDAYAITKDFQFEGQNNNKIFRQLYLESYQNTASTLSLAYSVDRSTTYATTTQAIPAASFFNDEIKRMFPGYAKGRYLRLKFSNNTPGEYLKVDGFSILGDIEKLYRR